MARLRDRLYAGDDAPPGAFRFDESVARVFADMVRRSVPGYELVAQAGGLVAAQLGGGGKCYDLGCSLGEGLAAVRRVLPPAVPCVGVDNSPSMLRGCARRLRRMGLMDGVELRCEDMCDTRIENAALVLMNYSLQFVPPRRRMALLRRVAAGLRPGGLLLLSEKLAGPGDGMLAQMHAGFKRAQGYSDMELARKRDALERVLVPDSLATHRRRLRRLGLGCTVWLQCFNFVSILAAKPGAA